jgi:RNA recognition motif-containing protein
MNIFVGNIAFTASEDDLRELFEQHGVVDKVHLIMDRYTGRSRGFGFVEMPSNEEARTAITALNGASLHNRALTVNEARPREPRRDGGGRRDYDGGGRRDY